MSYDLNFWRPGPYLQKTPQKIYEALCKGESVAELASLPIDDMIARMHAVFSDIEPFYLEKTCIELNWQGGEGEGAFQVTWSPQHFRIDCYGLKDQTMNQLVDIAYEFECSFYDPQVPQLYHATKN
ncbi:MAG: hypothetical protein ABIY70_04210 [Capsulimonas sp.]|uniref:hypothetical protein n=1 Tax=Capsulimonas sp. TaxID=2494211 RepID=UPI003263B1F5